MSLVLWDGNVGGAEKLTAELAGGLRGAGVETTVVFVRDPKHLGPELDRLAVPYVSLGARRVEEVLVHPRRFARLVAAHGPDGVLLPATGHQAPALRLGGYRAPIVAMEHGFLLLIDRMSPRWRTARRLERRLSAPFVDVEVAVSRFMAERVREAPHARRVEVIQNGIDAGRFAASEPTGEGGCTFAFASRLVEGKGLEELVAAFARLAAEDPGVRLKIAGDGPGRPELETALERHDVGGRVELAGVVTDMPSYWRDADVAVMPSTASESFGMVALEAMACGRPVVATRNGGADDLVDDGVTGRLVACGDVYALEAAMRGYARDPRLRRAHGRAGRERCEAQFTIDRCATRYARLLREAARERQSSASSRRTSTPRDLKRVSGHAE